MFACRPCVPLPFESTFSAPIAIGSDSIRLELRRHQPANRNQHNTQKTHINNKNNTHAEQTITNMRIYLLALCLVVLFGFVGGGSWRPFSTVEPPYPPIEHPLPLTSHWGDSKKPYPTNEWWMNLVLQPSNQPVIIAPLAMRIETTDTREVTET